MNNIINYYFKQLISILLSISLVMTGMPPVRAQEFLAPPGERELVSSVVKDGFTETISAQAIVQNKKSPQLKRELGLLDVFCIASGAMISSGLFILPAIIFRLTGPAMAIAYLIGGLFALPAVFSKAELSSAMPKSGGIYFFIGRSLGSIAGTLSGFASWFSLVLKSAFALVGMGIFMRLIPAISIIGAKPIAIVSCILLTILNITSVRHAGKFQKYLVFGLVASLVLYSFIGAWFIQPQNFVPFMPYGVSSLFAGAGMVFVSFGGLTKIAALGEEVKNPRSTIPKGIFLAFGVVMAIYFLVSIVTIGVINPVDLKNTLTPISDGAGNFLGFFGSTVMAVAAMIAFITTGNAGILSASRSPLAMSRDKLLPPIFKKISTKYRTPYISILVTSAFMLSAILFASLEDLVKIASTLKILLFMFANFSLIVMRQAKLRNYQPRYKAPFYPWMQIFGIVACAFLIVKMGSVPILFTGGFMVLGTVWYLLYGRTKTEQQSALTHIISNVTGVKYAPIDKELREIIIDTEGYGRDVFYWLVEECQVIDIREPLEQEEMFLQIAGVLCTTMKFNKVKVDEIKKRFLDREHERRTVIGKGVAIPHITVEGKNRIELILVRSEEGIIFPATAENEKPELIYAMFILASSDDAETRKIYLHVLAAISGLLNNNPEFLEEWRRHRNVQELKDLVHLSRKPVNGEVENSNRSMQTKGIKTLIMHVLSTCGLPKTKTPKRSEGNIVISH